MSKRDVDKYFQAMCKDYHDMKESLHDVEQYMQTNIVGPEEFDNIKQYIEIVKNNYLAASYIVFLLDKSKKDVDNYYEVICKDYFDTIETEKDAIEFFSSGIIQAEQLESIQSNAKKAAQNYWTISNLMYLLNMPVKHKKYSWYKNTNKYCTVRDLEFVHQENLCAITKIKESVNG